LPSKYLYDEVGSALFEVISVLPEYGLTRADERLLGRTPSTLSPSKIGMSLSASSERQREKNALDSGGSYTRQRTDVLPNRISPTALARCESELGRSSMSALSVSNSHTRRSAGGRLWRREHEHLLVLFSAARSEISIAMRESAFLAGSAPDPLPGRRPVLGRTSRSVPQLVAAYDDPIGVTAAFNLNLLAASIASSMRVLILRRFVTKLATTHPNGDRMHLRSLRGQTVAIAARDAL